MLQVFGLPKDGRIRPIWITARRKRAQFWWLFACALLLGCRDPHSPQTNKSPDKPASSVALRVGVVNDPGLADAIGQLRGEWAEISSGSLNVESQSFESVQAAESSLDLIVFPSRYLGQLCERSRLRPIRSQVLESEDYDAADVFPLVRDRLLRYGGETMALPLGVRVPLVCYRHDVLKSLGIEPPDTWRSYLVLASRLASESGLITCDPVESWGAQLFLARVAPMAVNVNREAILFDPETMQPRLTDPPFVRALENLVQLCRTSGVSRTQSCEAVAAGAAALAIGVPPTGGKWPAFQDTAWVALPKPADPNIVATLRWTELPAAEEVYRPLEGEWESSGPLDDRIPLLGTGGRLMSVTSSSRNAATAFRLLNWLCSSDVARQLGPASGATNPCRHSQISSARAWFDSSWPRMAGDQLARTIQNALSRQQCLVIPRIPGVDKYLQALQAAVDAAISQSASPEAALAEAVNVWNSITDRYGRESQRNSYRKHFNWRD